MANDTTVEPPGTTEENVHGCEEREKWIYFICSSIIAFLVGLCLILVVEVTAHACSQRRRRAAQRPSLKEEIDTEEENGGFSKSDSRTEHLAQGTAPAVAVPDDTAPDDTAPGQMVEKMSCMERARNKCELWISSQSAVGKVMVS